MTYTVEITRQADIDLRGIYEYIAFDLKAPGHAAGQLDRLEAQISSLDSMPRKFPAYRREPWRSRGVRMLPVDNYVVLYIPDDTTAVVSVLRVMYGGRDIDAQLHSMTI